MPMTALGRNQMSPSLVLNWMKSLMVGLLSAARFAAGLLTARLWARGSSGRGFWCDWSCSGRWAAIPVALLVVDRTPHVDGRVPAPPVVGRFERCGARRQ